MSIKRLKDFPDGSGALTNDDIFIFMDDPTSSAVTKKISLAQLSSAIGGGGGGYALSSATDVSISGLSHNDILAYNSGDSLWHNNSYGVFSEPAGITGASGINNIVYMSQASYSGIAVKDPYTIYFIV